MGRNCYGQLGDGTLNSANLPEVVAGNVVAAAAGSAFSMYLTADGRLWAMGRNSDGQLGDGMPNDTNLPVMVASNVVAVAAGGNHSLYVTADGNLWAMGRNTDGQLGDGTLNNTNLPVMVTNNVVAAAAGDSHSLYVTADGNLWAMGRNSFGQLGNGTLNSASLPVMVATNVAAAAAGAYHSQFITADGRPWAMGGNTDGQLGDGPLNSTNQPVMEDGGDLAAASLAKGPEASHSLAVAGAFPVVNGLTNQTENSGQPLTFNPIVTSGDGTYAFQWQLNGANIAGATNATYSVASPAAGNAGTYTVIVTATETGISTAASFLVAIGAGGPSITSQSLLSNGQFHLRFSGSSDAVYTVLASSDLKTWTVIGLATQTSPGVFDFTDVNSTAYKWRFYSVEQAVIAMPTMWSGAFQPNGAFRLQITGAANSYTVFGSSNLVQWVQLGPAVPIGTNLFQFIDTGIMPARFYRIRSP
jgi:hypothetical protein